MKKDKTIRKKIAELERESRKLCDFSAQQNLLNKSATEYAELFYHSNHQSKAFQPFDDTMYQIFDKPLSEEGTDSEEIFSFIEKYIISPGLNSASGRNFGYIPGSNLFASAIGDYMAAVTNRYASVYSLSPGPALLEDRLIKWMAELVGYHTGAGGYLSSGGSIANMTAVVAARDHAGLTGKDYPRAVAYLTKHSHHCIDRALNLAGLRECIRRYIPMDDAFRMNPRELNNQIIDDANKGFIPWLLVATAGTTNSGAVDPLDEIGSIARLHRLWFHVDAAYGGFFLLTGHGRRKLAGIELSDSVVLDPHKSLFLPYGTGALLVKDVNHLVKSHDYQANYLKHVESENVIYSSADISPELTKHFRALRMWLPLKLHGLKVFKEALEEKLLLANYLWNEFSNMKDIETGPPPELSIFMFRWVPKAGDPEEMNRKLREALLQDGRIFLSTTEADGKFCFRVAVLSVNTHLKEADILVDVVKEKIGEINN